MSGKLVNGPLFARVSTGNHEVSRRAPPADGKRTLLGVDENGLGPLLGPLVVTAARARATEAGAAFAAKKARGARKTRLGDSKGLVAFGESALGEAWARALARRDGADPASPEELFRRLSVRSHDELRAPCPRAHRDLCFRDGDVFQADEDLVRTCTKDIEALAKKGLELSSVRTVVVCNRRLNEAAARGISRFQVDLEAMEDLVLDAHEAAREPVMATLGRVGGYTFYSDKFRRLAAYPFETVAEAPRASTYDFGPLGELSFAQDADASHLLVGLASLVGKWVRDVATARITSYLRAHDATLPDASGYHDPVTRRFVEGTKALRVRLRVEDACFLRTSTKSPPSGAPKGRGAKT